ncbi:MAG TPA: ATP-binding protein, partial [Burkholderiaceae bacterium]|nr:ATP-binding protein [Burkholderiaceae bacterium]
MSLSPITGEDGLVAGSSLIARDIGERKRAEQSLHRRLRQLDLLSQAGQTLILGEGGPAQIQHDLFDRVRLAVGAEIWLRHELAAEDTQLQLTDGIGLSEAQHAALGELPPDGSLCGLAIRHGVPVIVEDLQASERPQAAALKAAGLCSFAAFPLRVQGRACAVSTFASTTRTRFREGDLQVIQTVCDQVSAMLERSRLLDELHQREQALRQADRAKDDFIATLAHELRNPLAPIANATGILRRAAVADPKLLWCRDVIERQVLQMTHLLEDLLDVSRVTRNKIQLRRERLDLLRTVEQALEVARPLIESRQQRLVLELDAAPIMLYGDFTRLTQVFSNLLDNAAKYTDAGGQITLTVRASAAKVQVRVRDSGIGIDVQQLPHVFEMFAQLAPALERSGSGLGIGLALTRGLVELHGGDVDAYSAGAGRGSEFVVTLPIEAAQRPTEDSAARSDEPAAEPPARRLLVVDDSPDAAQTLSMLLSLHGQDVRAAFTSEEALQIVQDWQPDAAVLDIGLPDLSGYELCRRIRAQPWGAQPLLIACTGWGQQEDVDRARQAGFDFHVVKPV